MNGQIFQLQLEQKKKGQFQETLNQLQIYLSSNYKKDIKHLKILFTALQQPVIIKPEIALASLYNVVWGQCSRLLQNKLKSSNKYTNFDNNCDVP